MLGGPRRVIGTQRGFCHVGLIYLQTDKLICGGLFAPINKRVSNGCSEEGWLIDMPSICGDGADTEGMAGFGRAARAGKGCTAGDAKSGTGCCTVEDTMDSTESTGSLSWVRCHDSPTKKSLLSSTSTILSCQILFFVNLIFVRKYEQHTISVYIFVFDVCQKAAFSSLWWFDLFMLL